MNKRQIAAQNTKRKLISTALELIKIKGFNAINVEDITQAAAVAKGTFYTYFKRKEDIVLEISRMPFSEIKDELEKRKDLDLLQKLTYYFHCFMECVEACGINVCRQWIKNVLDPNNVPENFDGQKWVYDFEMLKSILATAVKDGELRIDTPVDILAHMIISQLYGMMTCWCMSDGKFEPLAWTDEFCEIQLKKIFRAYLI